MTASTAVGVTAGQYTAHADETRTVTLGVASYRSNATMKPFDTVFHHCILDRMQGAFDGDVGWWNSEDTGCFAAVAQRAVRFDTGPLDAVPEKVITSAVLTYDEPPCGRTATVYPPEPGQVDGGVCWQSGGGSPENKPEGCVVVRVPAQDWDPGNPARGPLPHVTTSHPTITRIGTRAWDVTEPFTWQRDPRTRPLQRPGDPAILSGYGFLLTGSITSVDQLSGDDDTRCMSGVDNVQLQVTYTVPPPGGGFRPPN
ncbi:hypothetical protein A5662_21400 [Mycobacteriaceae bacterium 1482268.1]|nr:hypothetical protein A5662_21400 [Mycobacteriaceae bacterium 1482268.1]